MVSYEDTHPWIVFSLDVRRIPSSVWLLLGECVSKIHHIVGTPLMPLVTQRLNRTFVSKGIHGTAAIEGNTLELEEVERRLANDLGLPPSQAFLGQEIDNLRRAYELVSHAVGNEPTSDLSEERIQEYNRTILHDLELEQDIAPGVYATRQHGVPGYRAPSPTRIRELMARLVEWMNEPAAWAIEGDARSLAVGIIKAISAHLYIAWIHPFGDGNGRTARMVEAEILGMHGVPAITYHLLSDHYNRTRQIYYRRLAQTSAREEGDPYVFIAYAVEGLADGLRSQIDLVKAQHRLVVWRDFVHEVFRGQSTARYDRLRRVARQLGTDGRTVARSELRRLTPRLEQSYRGKGDKTVSRDINELVARGLVEHTPSGIRARLEILEAFTPERRQITGLER